MCDPVTASIALGAAGVQAYSSNKQAGAQRQANSIAEKNASDTAKQAEQANNRANAKTPDLMAMSSANVASAKGGQSGTLLTGPQGVDPGSLLLGKKTLLGG